MPRFQALALAVIATALVALLGLHSPFVSDLLLRMSTLAILATSWNMMANAGLISLGHSAFWGLGAYVAVGATNGFGLPFGLSLVPACLVGAGAGAVLAALTGRLRGVFFAITTLALSEGLRICALMLPDVTGGAVGVYLRSGAAPTPATSAALCAGCAVLATGVAAWLAGTRFQFASRALRNSEQASQMLGIDPRRHRVLVIATSGALASLAGGLDSGHSGYLDPDTAFSLTFTILPQIASIIGGLYTIWGPALGAVVVIGLGEGTRMAAGSRPGVSLLVYGVLLVLCVRFLRNGLVGWAVPAWQRRRGRPA